MSAQLETEKLRRQVSTLAAFGGQALRAQDVGELLQEATRLVSEAIEVDLVKVLEPIANGQELLVRAGVNWNPGVVGQATIPADGGSAAGHALRTNAPVISDVATERRFSTPRLLIEHGVQSTVNVVIRGEKGPFGVLEVDFAPAALIWAGRHRFSSKLCAPSRLSGRSFGQAARIRRRHEKAAIIVR